MNGRRRVMGWDALGCSNLTASRARGGVARDVTVMLRHGARDSMGFLYLCFLSLK